MYIYIYRLFGALEPWNFMTFHILGIVTPSDFHIFQRGSNHQPDKIFHEYPLTCQPAVPRSIQSQTEYSAREEWQRRGTRKPMV